MWLQTRMFLLVAVLFGILYGMITGVGAWMGTGSAISYIILAFAFLGIDERASGARTGAQTEDRISIYRSCFPPD